ncbi:transposase [Falsiroseomonas stagni]|uniref:Putative transposase of IS4/5 family n=1 Tax=Falsiroseomonas stagni DSM 19981 TaxID=1123062 RepID=A0A1I3YBB7_9PROT|nr:transposase [Falsiroseomonas stagni]SFK29148.1 Putative transposase of IS4/5 family [Falsiroseomonas stagni DSM 19981]
MLPLHPTPSHPWSPLTDEEWHFLEPYLRPTNKRTGRPPRDRRATWDAIFWLAVTNAPWTALQANRRVTKGNAHSALATTARTGVLSRLLLAVSRHPFADPALASLEYRIATTFRRASRIVPAEDLLLARTLGMATALPLDPADLPPPPKPGAPLPPDRIRLVLRIPAQALRGLPAPPPARVPRRPQAPLLPIAHATAQPRRRRGQHEKRC